MSNSATLRVADGPWLGAPRIDVDDTLGFELAFAGRGEHAEAEVVDVAPADRHLLLLVRREGEKSKFLCGHDERHWFVAAIPPHILCEAYSRGSLFARGTVRHPDHATIAARLA